MTSDVPGTTAYSTKPQEQLRAAVRHDGEPNPPGIATTLPLVELGARLALANLHSAGDKNVIVDATAFAARPAASPGFIDFDVLAGPAADPVLIRAHHLRAVPRGACGGFGNRLVARQAKLSPKLHGRHAGCLAGHQIGRPKPYAQRRVRARHDRSHRRCGRTAALAAAQNAGTICEAERLSRRLTMGANKPVAPASLLLQVGGAGRVVGKNQLELWERLWEPKIATLVNVHEHGRTLPLVAVGDNRIGKVHSFTRLDVEPRRFVGKALLEKPPGHFSVNEQDTCRARAAPIQEAAICRGAHAQCDAEHRLAESGRRDQQGAACRRQPISENVVRLRQIAHEPFLQGQPDTLLLPPIDAINPVWRARRSARPAPRAYGRARASRTRRRARACPASAGRDPDGELARRSRPTCARRPRHARPKSSLSLKMTMSAPRSCSLWARYHFGCWFLLGSCAPCALHVARDTYAPKGIDILFAFCDCDELALCNCFVHVVDAVENGGVYILRTVDPVAVAVRPAHPELRFVAGRIAHLLKSKNAACVAIIIGRGKVVGVGMAIALLRARPSAMIAAHRTPASSIVMPKHFDVRCAFERPAEQCGQIA